MDKFNKIYEAITDSKYVHKKIKNSKLLTKKQKADLDRLVKNEYNSDIMTLDDIIEYMEYLEYLNEKV
jgi:hypothetical protein